MPERLGGQASDNTRWRVLNEIMARQYWRPSNMLYPVPAVMISCADEEGRSNIMTAAWAGTICSDPVMVSVSIRPERYSHDVIARTKEFVINLTTEDLTFAADFCGVRSGRDVDKFEYLHLTKVPSQKVKAPSIGESPVCLECHVTAIEKLGTHDMFLAEVVQVSVDEQYLDEKGRFLLEDAGLAAYVHGSYFALGEKLGTFGFSVRKKEKKEGGKRRKTVPRKTRDAGTAQGRKKDRISGQEDTAAGRRKERPAGQADTGTGRQKEKPSGRRKDKPAGQADTAARRKKTTSVFADRISARKKKNTK